MNNEFSRTNHKTLEKTYQEKISQLNQRAVTNHNENVQIIRKLQEENHHQNQKI